MKFELGDSVRDTVTGYTGVVLARTEWLNGCVRYVLQPQSLNKEGKPTEAHDFDEEQLTLVKPHAVKIAARRTGGPRPSPRQQPAARR